MNFRVEIDHGSGGEGWSYNSIKEVINEIKNYNPEGAKKFKNWYRRNSNGHFEFENLDIEKFSNEDVYVVIRDWRYNSERVV